MVQFNIHRFGKLAKWTLSFDKGYYIKSFLQMFVIVVLLFAAFTTRFFTFINTTVSSRYAPCAAIFMGVLIVHMMIGPAMVFYNLKTRRDDQTYMMLPASNLEKYLVRYVVYFGMLIIYIVALVGADLVQYLLNVLIGKVDALLVMSYLTDRLPRVSSAPFSTTEIVSMNICIFWFNSLYALGGTFFRSHKYAWVFTTIIIIFISMLLAWLLPKTELMSLDGDTPLRTRVIVDILYAVWTVLNYWLAYKCFCRSQVIGKFVNI